METLLMKYCPATGGKSPRWLLRQGHSLGELFVLGAQRRSCWDPDRRTYTALEIFIRKKVHSVSGSEEAVCPSNAKRKRHCETGKWGRPQ